MAPVHNSVEQVFTTFNNSGNWQTQALSVLVGLIGNVFTLFGKSYSAYVNKSVATVANIDLQVPTVPSMYAAQGFQFGLQLTEIDVRRSSRRKHDRTEEHDGFYLPQRSTWLWSTSCCPVLHSGLKQGTQHANCVSFHGGMLYYIPTLYEWSLKQCSYLFKQQTPFPGRRLWHPSSF